MATPSQAKTGLLDIAQRINGERSRLKQAVASINQAKAVLDAMPAQYADFINSISNLEEEDVATEFYQAEATALVAEFMQLATLANDMQAAVVNFTP